MLYVAVEHKAQGVQSAVKMKDERIDFLKTNNRKIQEYHNAQVKKFLAQISDLEAQRDKFMRRGPNRQEVKELQDENQQLKKDLQETKTSLARKEDVLSELQLTKNNLVNSVTSWNRKYAECMSEKRDREREMQREIDNLKNTTTGMDQVEELQTELQRKNVVIGELEEQAEDTLKLRQELEKKEEVIEYLRAYTDPTDCMKVRLKQQQNLDQWLKRT